MSPNHHGWISPRIKAGLRDRARRDHEADERARLIAERAARANESESVLRLMDGNR